MIYEWLSQYSGALRALSNAGYFLLWGVFLQLMYLMFRRKRRSRLLISRGRQKDMDALCIISNMSAEAMFIEYIIAELETSRRRILHDVTSPDREYDETSEEENVESNNLRYGPLESGGVLHIGTFRGLVDQVARTAGIDRQGKHAGGGEQLRSLTIRLIGVHGPEDRPVGAERSFELTENGQGYSPTPRGGDTKQLSSRRQQRYLQELAASFSDQERHHA